MRFLIDTNVLVERSRSNPHPSVKTWFDSLVPFQVVLCPVIAAEFMTGVFKLPEPDQQKAGQFFRAAVQAFYWVDIDLRAATVYGQLRSQSKVKGGINDLWLSSVAIANNLIIATRNERDFKPYVVRTWNPFD